MKQQGENEREDEDKAREEGVEENKVKQVQHPKEDEDKAREDEVEEDKVKQQAQHKEERKNKEKKAAAFGGLKKGFLL